MEPRRDALQLFCVEGSQRAVDAVLALPLGQLSTHAAKVMFEVLEELNDLVLLAHYENVVLDGPDQTGLAEVVVQLLEDGVEGRSV